MRSTMMDAPLTISAILRYGTTAYAEREVVTMTAGGTRRRPYRDTGTRCAQFANALRALGVDGDQRVATLMWNNAEHLEAYLTIPSMGAVLHTLNLRLEPEIIGYIAEHAGDTVVLVDATLVTLLERVLPHAPSIRHIIVSNPEGVTDCPALDEIASGGRSVHDYEVLLAAQPASFDWPDPDERSAAAMCYTSGTTGRPKGVAYSHRSMHLHSMAACMGNVFGLSDRDRVMPVVPMFHANAWGMCYAAVMGGADLIMPDRFMQAAPLARLIEAERPTVAGAVPTTWSGLLQHVRAEGGDMSSMRLVICGGSAVPHALIENFEKELGVNIMQAWGMTEMSPLGSVARAPAGMPQDEAWRYRDSQGRLLCQVEGRIVGDGGAILPRDGVAVGEVEVRGPWVTGSYYQDDDQEKFRDGWLRTGDVGTIDPGGYVVLTDRAKDVIKSGGEWISSMELENALMAHPRVTEAAVIGVPDERWGERPLAAIVLGAGEPVTAAELRTFLGERVPRWQLPERWSFIAEVPKTSVGKFAKTVMRDAYARGDYEVIEAR
jgi:fatty-acyl-CoA synthase